MVMVKLRGRDWAVRLPRLLVALGGALAMPTTLTLRLNHNGSRLASVQLHQHTSTMSTILHRA